jgi:hypothetical protein
LNAINRSSRGTIAPHGLFWLTIVPSLSLGRIRWIRSWTGTSSTTRRRSQRTLNDGYGKLVSRFPHHSLIMALPFLLIPPMSLLIILFHEHHLLALMMLILPAYQTGFYLQTNPYNATHHQRTTTLFHTSLHLTFPTLMMSLESSHTIRRYIILPHTTHTPSPWPVSPHSVHLQQRRWQILEPTSVSPTTLPSYWI